MKWILLHTTLLFCSITLHANAEKKASSWEVGAGLSIFDVPHYLGADQNETYIFPFPYVVYRGDRFEVNREGVNGFLFDSDSFKLNLSVAGSLPVDSTNNHARRGMENLDLLIEAGPSAQWHIIETSHHLFRFDVPVRAAFSVGDEFFAHQGWTSNPRFYHRYQNDGFKVISTAGAVFSDDAYHGYIYDVDANEVLDSRSFYQSKDGLTGTKLSMTILKQFDRLMIGGNFRFIDLSQAENHESPLLIKDKYSSVAFFIGWRFWKS